jgi:hypothetical protein
VGLDASVEVYAQIAEEICLDYTDAFRAVAVEDEPNPAKLKWNLTRQELIKYCLTLPLGL